MTSYNKQKQYLFFLDFIMAHLFATNAFDETFFYQRGNEARTALGKTRRAAAISDALMEGLVLTVEFVFKVQISY